MWHLLAHATTVAATAETNETPVQDPVFQIQNGFFVPETRVFLLWAFANGLLRDQCNIYTPTLLQYAPLAVRPINLAAEPISWPPVADYRRNPMAFEMREGIRVTTINSANTSGVYHSLLAVADGPIIQPPSGNIYTIRGTATATLVANVWTQGAITWASNLPNGRYAAVGLRAISAGCIAARLIFPGQVYRPGCIGMDIEGDYPSIVHVEGGCGVMGYFMNDVMPLVEFLSISADTAETVYMDFVRVA